MAKLYKGSGKFKKILCAVLVIAAIIASCAVVAGISKKDTKTISPGAFERGALDANGEHIPSEIAIYTKEAFGAVGLRVEPDFEFKGTYDVYFYDEDNRFIESYLNLDKVYAQDYPCASKARIVIHPDIPEDIDEDEFKIKFWEVRSYARNLTITVDKKQNFYYGDAVNLFNPNNLQVGKTYYNGTDKSTWSSTSLQTKADTSVTEKIYIDGSFEYYDVYIWLETNELVYPSVALFDSTGKMIKVDDSYVLSEVESFKLDRPCWKCLTIKVPELDSYEGVHLMAQIPVVDFDSDIAPEMQCYIFGYND